MYSDTFLWKWQLLQSQEPVCLIGAHGPTFIPDMHLSVLVTYDPVADLPMFLPHTIADDHPPSCNFAKVSDPVKILTLSIPRPSNTSTLKTKCSLNHKHIPPDWKVKGQEQWWTVSHLNSGESVTFEDRVVCTDLVTVTESKFQNLHFPRKAVSSNKWLVWLFEKIYVAYFLQKYGWN